MKGTMTNVIRWLLILILVCSLAAASIAVVIHQRDIKQLNRTTVIQNQIQSTNRIQVYAGKSQFNDAWTRSISETWFSKEVTDEPFDLNRACARYRMTAKEIRAFSEHYEEYAIVSIPLRIENMSDVTIEGLQVSFVKEDAEKTIWLYSDYLEGEYGAVESQTTGHYTIEALVNLSVCPMNEVDSSLHKNGLKLLFDYSPANNRLHHNAIDVLFDPV